MLLRYPTQYQIVTILTSMYFKKSTWSNVQYSNLKPSPDRLSSLFSLLSSRETMLAVKYFKVCTGGLISSMSSIHAWSKSRLEYACLQHAKTAAEPFFFLSYFFPTPISLTYDPILASLSDGGKRGESRSRSVTCQDLPNHSIKVHVR